ncbi:MAG: TonB-dependent receptor [Bacteroidetes bacterium]|nr:TonB-dependent receptor [Bacteroidota bacterium]
MIRTLLRTATAASLLSLILILPAVAQTGSISGVVVDSETGETLIGANVFLEGTTIGTTTDLDGKYLIPDVEVGLHNLVFRYIGFQIQVVQNVEVVEGQTTKIDMVMTEESIGLNEVVVEARAIRDSDAVLLRDRQKSLAVSDAISAESISRSGSSNAADAMEKVTGASVVGGKYVYVRGLGERYASTQLNGVNLPTADPDKKAVQFDLFPSSLLDNIVTVKTFTPDKPGNFSGGLVDIGTKNFPEELDVSVSLSSSLNTQTHFNSGFLTYPGGSMDWLGIDDGFRSIPSALSNPSLVLPSPQRARRDPILAAQLDEASKAFNTIMSPVEATAPVNYKYSLSVGNQRSIANRPFGFVLGLSYGANSSYYDNGTTGRYSFTGSQITSDLNLSDRKGTQEVNWGGLGNLSYRFSPNHEIGLNTLYSRSAESTARYQVGTWPKELGDNPNSLRTNRYLLYTERQVISTQLRGKHYLPGLAASTIEWNASYANSQQDEPDRRFFATTSRVIGNSTVLSASSSGFIDPSRYFRTLNEDNIDSRLDWSIPFRQWNNDSGKLKFGGAFETANRKFTERIFAVTPSSTVTYTGDDAEFFSLTNMGIVSVDSTRGVYTFGNTVTDNSKLRNNYTGDRTVAAAYGMIELPLTGRLKAIAGARLETTDLSVQSRDSSLAIGKIDETNVLPSVNLVYSLTNNMNLRAAATKTLARPTFREVAPFSSFDFTVGQFRIGNPELVPTNISNYDLRWEWFTSPGSILAISGFYKDMQNPIEEVIIGGTNGQLQYQNVDEAKVLGAEVEVRSGLGFIGRVAAPFSLGLNASFVKSEVSIAESELEVRRAIDPEVSATRQLQGQSPYLVNADLSYDNNRTGTLLGVYFNVFGSRLSAVSLGGTPDVFERPSPQLDLTLSQKLRSNWTMKVSAKNLLNSAYRQTHRFGGEDYVYQEFSTGQSFSLGFSYTN